MTEFYEQNADSKNHKIVQKQKKLTVQQAYFKGIKQDPFDPKQKPLGYIIFGVSINRRLINQHLQFLPNYLTEKDLMYTNFGGNKNFITFVSQLTNVYHQNQTKTVHNLTCAIDIFALKFKQISLQGQSNIANIEQILTYSGAKMTNEIQSKCHIIFFSKDKKAEIIERTKHSNKIMVLVYSDMNQIEKIENNNVFICYQIEQNKNVSYAAIHNANPQKLEEMLDLFNLHSISTLTQAAALISTHSFQQQNCQKSENKLKQSIVKLIKISDSCQIQQGNIHLTIGATTALAFAAKAFFQDGDTISVDTPVYQGVHDDFQSRVSLKYVKQNMFRSTLLRRIIRAKQDGSKGFVIINPNNPTGYVYPREQIQEVGKWAEHNPDFTIISDQMYMNLVHGEAKTTSLAVYSNKLPNVITIRGFAKQFGLCGFKVAYVITCNQMAKQKYNKWKNMLVPHPYSLLTVANMMEKSDDGQRILKTGFSLAKQAIDITCQQLEKYNIKYMKPQAGVFVFIDLRKYLDENIHLNEYLVFKKLFYEYKVNVTCGLQYKSSEPGWFRICPVIDTESIRVGIRRIHLMLTDQPLS